MSKKKLSFKTTLSGLILMSLFTASFSFAGEENREKNKFGIYLGLIGDPFPTLIGGNIAYNLLSFARLSAGYGSISASTVDSLGNISTLKATTIGGGLKFMVPDWNFTPVAGINYANVSVTSSGSGSSATVGGFSGSAGHMYVTGGFDWQAANGFNIGAGYNYSLLKGVGGLPYINLGWFF